VSSKPLWVANSRLKQMGFERYS